MKNQGKTETKAIFKQMKNSSNAVTRSVLREILVKRIESGDILPAKRSL